MDVQLATEVFGLAFLPGGRCDKGTLRAGCGEVLVALFDVVHGFWCRKFGGARLKMVWLLAGNDAP